MKTQIEIYIESYFLIERTIVPVKSISKHSALFFYSINTPVYIVLGDRLCQISNVTVINDLNGIFFTNQ